VVKFCHHSAPYNFHHDHDLFDKTHFNWSIEDHVHRQLFHYGAEVEKIMALHIHQVKYVC